MAELKTRPTKKSVEKFINSVADENRRADCLTVMQIRQQITKAQPPMWALASSALDRIIISMQLVKPSVEHIRKVHK